MERRLGQPLFETDSHVWTWEYALLLGAHDNMWERVARQLVHGDDKRAAAKTEQPSVKEMVRAFRRSERLISGDECRNWLTQHRMSMSELAEAVVNNSWLDSDDEHPDVSLDEPPNLSRIYTLSVVTGALDELVNRLFLQLGIFLEESNEDALEGPPLPSVDLLPSGPWEETWSHLAPVIGRYAQWCSDCIDDKRLQTRLAMRRQDYTLIDATCFSFSSEAQALEARFCVLEDKLDVPALTEACGVQPLKQRGMAQTFPRALVQSGQQPTVVVDDELWLVHTRQEPSLEDDEVRSLIETEVRTQMAEGAARRHVRWC